MLGVSTGPIQEQSPSTTVVPRSAPFGDNKGAVLVTTQESTRAPTPEATSSGSEPEWQQIGLGFGLGIALMVGLYLLAPRRARSAGCPLTAHERGEEYGLLTPLAVGADVQFDTKRRMIAR